MASTVERVGRYRIETEVGRGAMGVVYRAQDPAIGRVVAIKTIRLSDLTEPAERERLRERLFREAQSAGMLSHPNIVTIYDIAEEEGLAYIFMEFVSGPPLERVLSDGEAPANAFVLSMLAQTAAALDYAHSKGIVHRDIKPANILLHDGSQAKITDFGVAKILSQQMTLSGAMMGTPNYMSPEQVQGHTVDGRADQFSLGVIAYEMLTGEKPFLGDYLPTLLYKIVREDPAPPQRLNPTLGAGVEGALRKALSKDPAERYENCSQFVAALAAACEASPGWHCLPRGASQSMPTLAGAGAAADAAKRARPAPELPPERPARREGATFNPLLKSLIWMLAGVLLVGLVLLGAQRFLFNREAEPAAATPAPPAATGALPADNPTGRAPDKAAAKPSPVGAPPGAVPGSGGQRPQTQNATGAPAEKPGEHTVQFLTDPPGAAVSVDGGAGPSCQSPCMLSLQPGRHVLNASLDGYRSYPKVFTVPQDSDVFLQLVKPKATLSITSSPPGASIQIDGVEQNKRTPAILNVAPGTYHVKVTRDGVPLEFEVTVKDGEFISKNVSF